MNEYKITRFKNGKPFCVDTIVVGKKNTGFHIERYKKIFREEDGWTYKAIKLSEFEMDYGARATEKEEFPNYKSLFHRVMKKERQNGRKKAG